MINNYAIYVILSLIINYNSNAQTDIHQRNAKLKFVISFDESESNETLDGRMLLNRQIE